MPKVTVLMAVYNGMPYLPEAMDSILNQTFTDFEFLIINDCSTDDTREVIIGYDDSRIRLVDNKENIKQTRSLNKGLELATGEFIARMDADDVSHPDRLEKQYQFLVENPDVAVLGSSFRLINEKGQVFAKINRPENDVAIRWLQFFTCPIANGASMFRKDIIWDELRGYNPNILISQDWDLWSRVPLNYHLGNLPEYLLDIRQHSRQETVLSRDIAYKEDRYVTEEYLKKIFTFNEKDIDMPMNVDSLLKFEAKKRKNNPQDFLYQVENLFKSYCSRYPSALVNFDVKAQLTKEYALVISCSGFRHWRVSFKVLGKILLLLSERGFLVFYFRGFLINTFMKVRKKLLGIKTY